MAGYAALYRAEIEAHRETRRRLTSAHDFAESFREYIRAKSLHQDVLEFMLVRHLGEDGAKRILDACERNNVTATVGQDVNK